MLHETNNQSNNQRDDRTAQPPEPEEEEEALQHWLLLIYRIPSEPSSARTAVWRETRRLGALSLQHAVCLFPQSEANQAATARLVERITEYGGEATLLEAISPTREWQRHMIARMNAARNEEYEEVIDETERFHEEIARERRKGKYTFAELEDEESNLRRLRKYLGQVQARDTFQAPERVRAEAEVERCAVILEIFAQEIYERNELQDDQLDMPSQARRANDRQTPSDSDLGQC